MLKYKRHKANKILYFLKYFILFLYFLELFSAVELKSTFFKGNARIFSLHF